MNIKNLISKLVAQICEKNFSQANETLDAVVTEKVKTRVKKTAEKLSPKQKEIAKAAKPYNKITGADFKALKKSSKKVTKKNK
jgi:succinate dehydrogenase/fumarate reductase flavoprotein subunit